MALGAYCRSVDDSATSWEFFGWASSNDGQQVIHESSTGPDPDALANAMVEVFLDAGVREILST